MDSNHIEADYLVVGAGAAAMAFVDTLLDESDATVVMVDRHHQPGGHWNDAYPFVRLHQPSAFYGVNSRVLGSGSIDRTGLNQGLSELASGAQVLDYFDQVMNQRFLPSGRVRWLPMTSHELAPDGMHRLVSLLGGGTHTVTARRKLVDATRARTAVPSTHRPAYAVAPGVRCVPPNELPHIGRAPAGYTVIGAGKTGIDTCLWLLQSGVAPSHVRWVMPRDPWLLDRANVQPGAQHLERFIGSLAAQFEAIAAATSVADLFARLEASGQLLRIDPTVEPTVYRCATVTQAELQALRRIGSMVRMGRVQALHSTRIVLEDGSLAADPDTIYVDCSAHGLSAPPPGLRVFDGDTVNLLMVRTCQPVFSAALIAYVESRVADVAERNALCGVVPVPERPADWLRMWSVNLANGHRWSRHEGLTQWLLRARLDGVACLVHDVKETETAMLAQLQRYRAGIKQAVTQLPRLMAEIA